jgi:hypothetical protein
VRAEQGHEQNKRSDGASGDKIILTGFSEEFVTEQSNPQNKGDVHSDDCKDHASISDGHANLTSENISAEAATQ